MSTTPRRRVVNQKASEETQQKVENCEVIAIDDELREKSNGKTYCLVRVRLPKSYNNAEVLASQTGNLTVEVGDMVNLYHRTYNDKDGIKRHHFDIQEITGLATTEELDTLFQ